MMKHPRDPRLLLGLQAGNPCDTRGGASSEEDCPEPTEPRSMIDDEGEVTFQDIIKDSLEEEVHAFMAEIEHNRGVIMSPQSSLCAQIRSR